MGYRRRLDLQAALRELRIPYVIGKGGTVISTVQAVNAGLLCAAGTRMEGDSIEF